MLLSIKRQRLERGLAQKEAASRVGLSPQALSRIESGQMIPWPALRRRLARLYDVPENVLWHDVDDAQRYLREKAGETPCEPSPAP
jgi:transcriptional regulator with XRE-family HTH domain